MLNTPQYSLGSHRVVKAKIFNIMEEQIQFFATDSLSYLNLNWI